MNVNYGKIVHSLVLCAGLFGSTTLLKAMDTWQIAVQELTPNQLRKKLSDDQIKTLIRDVFSKLKAGNPFKRASETRDIFEARNITGVPTDSSRTSQLFCLVLSIPPGKMLNRIPLDRLDQAEQYALRGELCGKNLKELIDEYLEKHRSFTSQYLEEGYFTKKQKKRRFRKQEKEGEGDKIVSPKRLRKEKLNQNNGKNENPEIYDAPETNTGYYRENFVITLPQQQQDLDQGIDADRRKMEPYADEDLNNTLNIKLFSDWDNGQ